MDSSLNRLGKQITSSRHVIERERHQRLGNPPHEMTENLMLCPSKVGKPIDHEKFNGSEWTANSGSQGRARQPKSPLIVVPVMFGETLLVLFIDAS